MIWAQKTREIVKWMDNPVPTYITLFVALNYVLPSSLVERNMDLKKNSKKEKRKEKSERNDDDVAKPIIFHLQRAAC